MQTRRDRTEYKLKHIIGTINVWRGRRRSHFYYDKHQKKLVIGERYEKKIKALTRIVLLISIITSIIAISPPFSIFVSLGLILLEQSLERIIYSFQSILVVPFPDFDTWKKAGFQNMMFAKFGKMAPHEVAMIFNNPSYARDVWKFIEGWNYGKSDDRRTNNITVSFVINRKKSAYALFVYPSYDRPSTRKAKKLLQKGKEDKEQMLLVGQMIMCRVFPFKNSAFEKVFLPNYKPGEDYLFSCWVMGDPPTEVTGTMKFRKNDLKIKDLTELTRKDIEYHMSKYRIDWVNPGPDKESIIYTR